MSLPIALIPSGLAAEFDWREYLLRYDERLLRLSEGRRILTRINPILWSLVYFPHHLASDETGGQISFSRFHLELCEHARQWARRDLGPAEIREAWIAPRGSGKTSWLFLILPLWALAHGHRSYVAAFADSASQAEQHLLSAKNELDNNALLRRDFPDLCTAALRPRGTAVSDNRSLLIAKSGSVFSAKGIDSSVLGAKVSNQRPDLLLFDDVEPDASNYSALQKEKRLDTIINAVFPMNDRAVVEIVGTTTMPGSIIHDLAKTISLPGEEPAEWIVDEKMHTNLYPALEIAEDGSERSLWPQRWALEYLQSISHTRSFRLNLQNDPMAADGEFWTEDDFRYDVPAGIARRLLSIDPATTTKSTSDFTGLAVVGYDPFAQRCALLHSSAKRLPPGELRAHVLALIEQYDIGGVLIETNQGGDAWAEILSPLPVKLASVHQTEPKHVRAARVLDYYQSGWVAHDGRQRAFEEQAVSFPKGAHDDVVDAVGSGVNYFLKDRKRSRQAPSQVAYA